MPDPPVELRPLTEAELPALLAAAVADADPLEVMPPVAGPPGWNGERRAAFLAFHRSRSLAAEPVETTYVVVTGGQVVGAARLEPCGDGVEMGVWIGRRHRGTGIGRAVADRLVALAGESGARRVIASTTPDNRAAQQILEAIGATRVTETDDRDERYVRPVVT